MVPYTLPSLSAAGFLYGVQRLLVFAAGSKSYKEETHSQARELIGCEMLIVFIFHFSLVCGYVSFC
jgi:hypothetical protein